MSPPLSPAAVLFNAMPVMPAQASLRRSPSSIMDVSETGPPRKRLKATPVLDEAPPAASKDGRFPIFSDGDLIIAINEATKTHVWRLHSTVLARFSAALQELLGSLGENDDIESTEPKVHYITLSEDQPPSAVPPLTLCRPEQLEMLKGTEQDAYQTGTPGSSSAPSVATGIETSVKSEGVGAQSALKAPSGPPTLNSRVLSQVCAAYDTLFKHFYGIPIRIDSTNVHNSLFQAEILLPAFKLYGCLEGIRPHLGNLFAQYRHRLYEAIAQDPVRWLNISIPLQSASIYTEAFVHIAGSLNSCSRIESKSDIPSVVLPRLKKKNDQLKALSESVVGELFRLTILVDDKPVRMTENLETWTTVQLFRDWLALELDKIERRSPASHRRSSSSNDLSLSKNNTAFSGIGTLLRRIFRGGDAYLAYDEVLKELKESHECLGGDWEDLADDLRSLKRYAAKTVDKICQNNLMIDADSRKIPYLTCVDVGMKDFPWADEAYGG